MNYSIYPVDWALHVGGRSPSTLGGQMTMLDGVQTWVNQDGRIDSVFSSDPQDYVKILEHCPCGVIDRKNL